MPRNIETAGTGDTATESQGIDNKIEQRLSLEWQHFSGDNDFEDVKQKIRELNESIGQKDKAWRLPSLDELKVAANNGAISIDTNDNPYVWVTEQLFGACLVDARRDFEPIKITDDKRAYMSEGNALVTGQVYLLH